MRFRIVPQLYFALFVVIPHFNFSPSRILLLAIIVNIKSLINQSEIHYLEVSSLQGPASAIAQPFLFITRSVLLLIESGALDPEREPGSGVSYGDRGGYYGLRRMRSGTGSALSGESGRLSTLLGTSGGAARSRWPSLGRRSGKCC